MKYNTAAILILQWSPSCEATFCLFGFNVAFKHLRSYHDGCEATLFAFQEGWPLGRGRNQYIYVTIYNVEWLFQRSWPIERGSTVNHLFQHNMKFTVLLNIPVT